MKNLTARRVRKYRRLIAKEACPAKWGIRHRWAFDGYFWHHCTDETTARAARGYAAKHAPRPGKE